MAAMDEQERRERLAALRWQVAAGADEALAAAPVDRLSAPAVAAVAHSPVAVPQPAAMEPTAAAPPAPPGAPARLDAAPTHTSTPPSAAPRGPLAYVPSVRRPAERRLCRLATGSAARRRPPLGRA